MEKPQWQEGRRQEGGQGVGCLQEGGAEGEELKTAD